jgi:hypothetical protein
MTDSQASHTEGEEMPTSSLSVAAGTPAVEPRNYFDCFERGGMKKTSIASHMATTSGEECTGEGTGTDGEEKRKTVECEHDVQYYPRCKCEEHDQQGRLTSTHWRSKEGERHCGVVAPVGDGESQKSRNMEKVDMM